MTREEFQEQAEELKLLTADGFEDAVIGLVERFGMEAIVLYDRDKCIQILLDRDGMTYDGATEFFDFNVIGAWMGDATPAFATLITPDPA